MSAVSPAAPAEAASALFERHGGRVLRFCRSRLGSHEDAEDATQTTFLNAVGALRRGTVPRSEAAWLLRIAENVCHHRHRTAARRHESACDPTVLEDVVEAAPARPDELIHLAAGLESLPERQRQALLLREWQGLSYREIGAELGVSHAAVETLLFRARRGLASALERDARRGGFLGLLGWVKAAAGSATGLKVAAALVVAGVAVVPAREAPVPTREHVVEPRAVVTDAPAAKPVITPPPLRVAPRRDVTAPKTIERRTSRPPTPVRGGRPAEPEPVATAAPSPAPTPTANPPEPAPPSAAPPAPLPAPPAAPPAAPAPQATLPVEPPVQLPPLPVPPLPVPPLPVPPLPVPPLPVPALPDPTQALPTVELPVLPELPKLPKLP